MQVCMIEEIGSGVSAKVYKAVVDGNICALKAYAEGTHIETRQNELKSMLKVGTHTNIVSLLDYDRSGKLRWIALEMCIEDDLFNYILLTGPFELRFARYIIYQVLMGLEHIHSKKYVHRDVKADNIIFREGDFTPLISDFGWSTQVSPQLFTIRHGGTENINAPELFMKENLINTTELPSAESFSLAVLAYTIVLGHPPYSLDMKDAYLKNIYRKDWNAYWNLHQRKLDPKFRDLIENTLTFDRNRPAISQIAKHPFFGDDMPTKEEYIAYMQKKTMELKSKTSTTK